MSAIYPTDNINAALGPDGVRRYKTRCKILVHSHTKDKPMEIYDAVYAVDIAKAIKGAGSATFTLTPIQNFINLIFPNDVVNIYFDVGDRSGWTRTFFGYVDRVEENYAVDNNGKPTTYYRVVCTDFSKAFEKTQIYFNPQIAGRPDFSGYDFAKNNVDGLALLSKGITVGGAPSDVIENIILMLLGFGTQFRLPPSYNADETRKRLRQKRAEIVRGQLPPELDVKRGSMIAQYEQWKQDLEEEATRDIGEYFQRESDPAKRAEQLATDFGVPANQLQGTQKEVAQVLSSYWLRRKLEGGPGRELAGTDLSLGSRRAHLLDSISADATALVDVVDIFTFIERKAMDGWILGKPVWQESGTVMSLLRLFSNEAINELFLDLRPLNMGDDDKTVSEQLVSGKYARLRDDAGGNQSDNSIRSGVTYIPAVVMREYPFSVIDGVDLSSVKLDLKSDNDTEAEGVGYMPFGAIFAAGKGKPGRHTVDIDNINISDRALGKSTGKGTKHIDVAVIHEEEIKKTTLGRSDKDHFNLFEMYSDSLLGTDQKFYMQDFLPIITPIHILRNGLRLRTVTTTAARFSLATVRNLLSQINEPTDTKPAVTTGEPLFTSVVAPTSPIDNSGASTARFSTAQAKSNYNYRLKEQDGQKLWKWHHGVDITWKVPGGYELGDLPDPPIPVRAIADGEIWVAAPDGVVAGYGNVVVIRHYWQAKYVIFSVYAHLSSIEKRPPGIPKGGEGKRRFYFTKDMTGCNGGVMQPIPVNQGDVIGYLGRSGTETSRPHLHFEIVTHWPCAQRQGQAGLTPHLTASASDTQANAPAQSSGGRTPLADTPFDSFIPPGQSSYDPVKFYHYFASQGTGSELSDLIADTSATEEDGEQENDRTGDYERPQDAVKSPVVDGVTDPAEEDKDKVQQSTSRQSVDTATSRTQLIRWAVLQDHWYQHNLEYLSGRIDMRGAPEIRVGYRLDVAERDLSFYVEAVQHSWRFPNNMNTSLMVSRGQPNNPFPMYVLPPKTNSLEVPETQRRTSHSRLGKYFLTPDPIAIRRSLFIRSSGNIEANPGFSKADFYSTKGSGNVVDDAGKNATTDPKTGLTTLTYNDDVSEKVILAGSLVELVEEDGSGDPDDPNSRQDSISESAIVPKKRR